MKPARKTNPADIIREECEARGWSVIRLARNALLRIDDTDALYWGLRTPTKDEALAIGRAFGLSEECAVKLFAEVTE